MNYYLPAHAFKNSLTVFPLMFVLANDITLWKGTIKNDMDESYIAYSFALYLESSASDSPDRKAVLL